jgi:hypothetical protein
MVDVGTPHSVIAVLHVPTMDGVVHGLVLGWFTVSARGMAGRSHFMPGMLVNFFVFMVLHIARSGRLAVGRRVDLFGGQAIFVTGRMAGVMPVVGFRIVGFIFHDYPPYLIYLSGGWREVIRNTIRTFTRQSLVR